MPLEDLLARIPYVVWHDMRILEHGPGRVRLSLRGREEIANYIGVMHAGALYTLAETAAGVVANDVIADGAAYVLLRQASVRYTRRAEGEVVASAGVDDQTVQDVNARFAGNLRADVGVDARIVDDGGNAVFEGSFVYALRPRKP